MKHAVACITALCTTLSLAAPRGSIDACYLRSEPAEPASTASAPSGSGQSFLGMRRKSEQLFELDISVAGPNLSTCTVAGIAKLRGEAGAEALAMVVRPDPSRKSGRSGTLCQVFVHLTPAAIEVRTTPAACQAQALCEGKVELNGQRFEHASKLPLGAKGPCFETAAPSNPRHGAGG